MRVVHWFRNDLRLHDNTALHAAARGDELIPLFVLDPALLARAHVSPPRRRFLAACLSSLAANLAHHGAPLVVRVGDPATEVGRLLDESRADRLVFNRDTTPYARRRDAAVRAVARARDVVVEEHGDRVVFEAEAIRSQSGGGFTVFTPYRNAWLARYRAAPPPVRGVPRLPAPVTDLASAPLPDATALGAADDATAIPSGGEAAALRRLERFAAGALRDYARDRDRPDRDGTSRLSPHLRFGTISVRRCVARAAAQAAAEPAAAAGAGKWIDELIWREFYAALLAEHPRVLGGAFRRQLAGVAWNDDPAAFAAWCAGRTGYPIVDAAMRQLARTGWMHNRARMIVASFLTKDLLLDWRAGERVFMRHLVDGDPASNNGGWQWAASTGTDPQPYFRIFNPVLQGERFDPDGAYVRRYVPELRAVDARFVHAPWLAPRPPRDYPPPIVDHAERRVAAIARYEAARAAGGADGR
ncbi:deoxyribodipyrimidine photo-lyase [bacterium]|nr:deoxyribodipyrimidine photo-lyase [bacterium]